MIVYSPNALKPNTYVLSRYVPLMQDEKKLVINLGTFKVTNRCYVYIVMYSVLDIMIGDLLV